VAIAFGVVLLARPGLGAVTLALLFGLSSQCRSWPPAARYAPFLILNEWRFPSTGTGDNQRVPELHQRADLGQAAQIG